MGTDISIMIEAKISDRWVPILEPIWPSGEKEDPLAIAPNIPRHYGLFSLLADVRNRTGRGPTYMMKQEVEGFGEVEYPYDTDDGGHDPITPIDVPRGIPDDAPTIWKQFCAQFPGTHDPTWLTLDEIDRADWDQVLYEDAVAFEDEYLEWQRNGEAPAYRSRGAGGPGLRVVNEVEYAAGVRGEKQTAVQFRWKEGPLRASVPPEWRMTLQIMHMVAPHQDPVRMRMLIVFDS